ncbi:TRAP transporter small permease subunit [Thalassolituus sp. LLYu03]|uniref:TRAP transporter small permease subunit n=1 Tax=Thalassolituus sp. LLYu03 TaxID=3421656 RepID=UPI003D26C13C
MNNDLRPQLTVPLADAVDRVLRKGSEYLSWIYAILIAVILLQVTLRRGFSAGLIALEELQWHLYAIGVLFGVIYAQATNSHVRVDVLQARFSARAKSLAEIAGILILALPFLVVVFIHSLDFVAESWRISERSLAPAGLPWRWLIKSMIPVSVGLMMLAFANQLLRETVLLMRGNQHGN